MKKLMILIVALSFSCNTYKRIDFNGKKKTSKLCSDAIIVMKSNGMVLLKDNCGSYEQTFHKPTVKKYKVGETLKL
jgi:hypothetical protein